MEDIFAFKVALWGDVIILTEDFDVFFADDVFNVVRLPDEELALYTFAIRVLRGVEAAIICVVHLTENVVERLDGDVAIERFLGGLMCLKIGDDELGIVVQHLLKVRDKPVCIGGVSVETAAELVIHTTACHLLQREFDHF